MYANKRLPLPASCNIWGKERKKKEEIKSERVIYYRGRIATTLSPTRTTMTMTTATRRTRVPPDDYYLLRVINNKGDYVGR